MPTGYARLALAHAGQISLPLAIAHQCGQAFRWRQIAWRDPISEQVEVEWSLCLRDGVVFVRQDNLTNSLYFRTDGFPQTKLDMEAWLRDYLNLGVPLEAWYKDWCERDPIFAKHAQRFGGVTILRQDPWECMCAFICSSNNNISRISQMVHKLCDHFSEPILTHVYPEGAKVCKSIDSTEKDDIVAEGEPLPITYNPFPSPMRLAQPDVEAKLRALGFGYRAKFLAGTARALCEKFQDSKAKAIDIDHAVYEHLLSLRTHAYDNARAELMTFPGIGPKVAEYVAYH